MPLVIVEVMERSEQGLTKPYKCRGDDGETYFVKGLGATKAGLIREWLCARLGEAFGLPIAPYQIAEVPEELMEANEGGWLSELGSGEVFASQRVAAIDLSLADRDLVPHEQRCDVVVFDWWVRNQDRLLSELGGNPNLLWAPSGVGEGRGKLVVIDHNLAFDLAFSEKDFVEGHVFAEEIDGLFNDLQERSTYQARLATALGVWQEACDKIPRSWWFVDPEQTIPVEFDLDQMLTLLRRSGSRSFWTLNQ